MRKILALLLLATGIACASTWTMVQEIANGCAGGVSVCAVGFTVTAGNTVVMAVGNGSSASRHIVSVTGGGAWTIVPAQAAAVCTATPNCLDMAVLGSATGGAQTVTVTLNGTEASFFDIAMLEFSCGGCTGAALDAAATSSSGACSTSCPGASLTLATTPELIVYVSSPSISGGSPVLTSCGSYAIDADLIFCYALAATTGAAPTMQQSPSSPFAASVVSVKATFPGGKPAGQFPVVN